MKRLMIWAMLFVGSVSQASDHRILARHGVVEAINCGEIDPEVVGDACVARLRDDSGVVYGLIASLDLLEHYSFSDLAAIEGHKVDIDEAGLRRVDDAAVVDVLSVAGEPQEYYWWDGNWRLDE